jgi:hypothetical protein
MAYALGGGLFLVGIVVYAAVETRRELRFDRQQLAAEERTSNLDRPISR